MAASSHALVSWSVTSLRAQQADLGRSVEVK